MLAADSQEFVLVRKEFSELEIRCEWSTECILRVCVVSEICCNELL